MALLAPLPGARAAPPVGYRNPVIAADFPDPSVLADGGSYWAFSTGSANGILPIARSGDLVHWQPAGTVFPRPPSWGSDSFWAPHIATIEGRYVIHYSARRRGHGLCVAVATAPAVAGPYADGGPIVCQRSGSIDPASALDEAGRPYLVWKEDGNSRGRPTVIWAQATTAGGTRLSGPRQRLLRDRSSWERRVVEAPEIVHHGGWLYLFYSGGDCCGRHCDYGVGVARSRRLLGPWARAPRNPVLRGSSVWRCPGHGNVFTGPGGRSYMLLHAYRRAGGLGPRQALLEPVRWGRDGWPRIGSGGRPSVRNALNL